MLDREIPFIGPNAGVAKDRAGDFGKSVRKKDQWLRGRAQHRRAIRGMEIIRLGARLRPPEGETVDF